MPRCTRAAPRHPCHSARVCSVDASSLLAQEAAHRVVVAEADGAIELQLHERSQEEANEWGDV
jgi:hypothetical protein